MLDESLMGLSLTQSLAERAIDSIKLGGKREIRNSLSLFKSFFNRLDMEYVSFYRARYIQIFKSSPDFLVKKMVNDVDKDILKSIIVNMIYGVFLKGGSVKSNFNGSWIKDLTSSTNLKADILKYNSLGIFSFFINTDIRCDNELFSLIKANKRCLFFLFCDKKCQQIKKMSHKSENICYFLSVLAYNIIGAYFKSEKLLYGVIKSSEGYCLEDEIKALKKYDSQDLLFIAYYNLDMKMDNPLYNEIYKIRKDLDLSMAFLNLNGLYKRIEKRLMED